MKMILVGILMSYAAIAAVAWFLADRMIFLPPPPSYAHGDLPIELVGGEDGAEIAVLHLPNADASFTILYIHGNAEDLGHIAGILEELRRIGFSVLAFDYRGYGLSTGGPPTAEGASRDLRAVYRYAREELSIPDERLVLYGRSVGSGPAVELAAQRPVAGLVVESAFVSAFQVVTRVPLLPFDKFPNLRNIRQVGCPVLVIHGSEDEIISVSHGRRLFASAPEPKQSFWVEGAGHNDLIHVAGPRYAAALHAFLLILQPQEAS